MRRRPRTIPAHATVEHSDGATRYLVDGQPVARVIWHDNGHPAWFWHLDAEGRHHGLERELFEDGTVQWETRHVHGLQHGLAREWDCDGQLICATRFVRGTGRDLWWGGRNHLAELREYVDGQRHGLEQWWDSPRTVFREERYYQGLEHGISREWTGQDLDPGFPRFHLHGRRVSRAVYLETAISDPTVPPYLPADDRRVRRCHVPPRGLVPALCADPAAR